MTDTNTAAAPEVEAEETKQILVKVPKSSGTALKLLAAIGDTTVQALVAGEIEKLVKRNKAVIESVFSAKSA